jgi:hypothetical protein
MSQAAVLLNRHVLSSNSLVRTEYAIAVQAKTGRGVPSTLGACSRLEREPCILEPCHSPAGANDLHAPTQVKGQGLVADRTNATIGH